MNLPQALLQRRFEEEVRARALEEARAKVLASLDGYKVTKYFPNCLPGCVKGSLRIEDHVVRPGDARPTCRILYVKHRQFMRAGRIHIERLFLAANRIGKTECAAFEIRNHLTGRYPTWWQGRRFEHPTQWWAAGDTRQTTRDIIQQALMGPHDGVPTKEWGGMLDPHLIADTVNASGGVAHCLDTVYVEHLEKHHGAPMLSELMFKSYDQGRRVFQGTSKHGIWLDEEPPDGAESQESQAQGSSDIWVECLLRTMTTEGLILATFTPLRGLTPFLQAYLELAWMPGSDTEDVDLDDGTAEFDGLAAPSAPLTGVPARGNFFPDVLDLAGVTQGIPSGAQRRMAGET